MSDTPNIRLKYFIIHYLPWIILVLSIVGISIIVYHCIKGNECNPKKKIKNENVEGNLLEYSLIND